MCFQSQVCPVLLNSIFENYVFYWNNIFHLVYYKTMFCFSLTLWTEEQMTASRPNPRKVSTLDWRKSRAPVKRTSLRSVDHWHMTSHTTCHVQFSLVLKFIILLNHKRFIASIHLWALSLVSIVCLSQHCIINQWVECRRYLMYM